MENPAAFSIFTKNTAREYLATGKLPDNWEEGLRVEADLVANTYSCSNCDDRKCMGCIFREYDHKCADDCPFCC